MARTKKERSSLEKYGVPFQKKLIKAIIDDNAFARQFEEVLEMHFFELDYLQLVVRKLYEYINKYKVHPSKDTLGAVLRTELTHEDEIVQSQVQDFWKEIEEAPESDSDLEYTKEESLQFARKQKMRSAMLKSINHLENMSFSEIQKEIEEALRLGSTNDLGHQYVEDFEDRYKPNVRNAVSTGWPIIDRITKGGLGRGELGVVIAGTGVGKSFAVVNIGVGALLATENKTVVYYSLELDEEEIGRRFDSCITGCPLDDLDDYKINTLERIKEIKSRLYIRRLRHRQTTILTLENHLNKLVQRGHNIGTIIIDYADRLKPSSIRKEKYNELEEIYEDVRDLGKGVGVPIWTPSQANRCFWVETPLLVSGPIGIKRVKIGDVKAGELVDTHKGWRKVTKVFPKEVQNTYKITLKSGRGFICSAKHKFPTSENILKSISSGLSPSDNLLCKKEESTEVSSEQGNWLLNIDEFEVDEIVSIEEHGELETVDIAVEDTHMFYLENGVYTHNSSVFAEILTLDSIAAAYAKANPADFIMTISRNMEESENNTGKTLIAKNRLGDANIVLPLHVDLARANIQVLNDELAQQMSVQMAKEQIEKSASKNQQERLAEKYRQMRTR